jgi:hypothetical protein
MGGLLAAFSRPIGEARMLLLLLRAKEVLMRDVALNELFRRRVGMMQNPLVLSSGTLGFSFVLPRLLDTESDFARRCYCSVQLLRLYSTHSVYVHGCGP